MNLTSSKVNEQPEHDGRTKASEQDIKTARGDARAGLGKMPDEALLADSSLFSLLAAPDVLATTSPQEFKPQAIQDAPPAAHTVTLPPHLSDDMILNALEVQITDELDGTPDSMSCTLLLPHLGEVKMNATQSASQWHIHLAFNRPEALEYARRTQSMTTQRLREKLGSNVVLGLSLREEREADE